MGYDHYKSDVDKHLDNDDYDRGPVKEQPWPKLDEDQTSALDDVSPSEK